MIRISSIFKIFLIIIAIFCHFSMACKTTSKISNVKSTSSGIQNDEDLSEPISFLTYNIHYKSWRDSLYWIRTHAKDVMGFQEVVPSSIPLIHSLFSDEYDIYTGIGRDGNGLGEHSPIVFRKNKFSLKEGGTFWLNPYDRPVYQDSLRWGSDYNRIAVWVILKDLDNRNDILVINTHFCHMSELSRTNSLEKLAATVRSMKNKQTFSLIVVMGDFNMEKVMSKEMRAAGIVEDALSPTSYIPGGSRIDHILYFEPNGLTQHASYQSISDKNPSDHLAVYRSFITLKGL